MRIVNTCINVASGFIGLGLILGLFPGCFGSGKSLYDDAARSRFAAGAAFVQSIPPFKNRAFRPTI